MSDKLDHQDYAVIPRFELESGQVLHNAAIAYKTYGKLNMTGDNVMVVCHPLSASADIADWWGPWLGHGKIFDPSRFFIFCANILGSPYGSASPLSIEPSTGEPYGPRFPNTTIRDDIRIHKLVLDKLGVRSVAVVVGASMGGMAALEWPLCTPPGYVHNIIVGATTARQSAWCIAWGEVQRQCIYADPLYAGGYYARNGEKPTKGLAAARMAALLTYRSRDSFENRFGRNLQFVESDMAQKETTHPTSPVGHISARNQDQTDSPTLDREDVPLAKHQDPHLFMAQSYLRYQGKKFNDRFDANCYLHITRKMDTHDVGRGRRRDKETEDMALRRTLAQLPRGALVIGIEGDGLFVTSEQREIAAYIPEAQLVLIPSTDGHDGFMTEFEAISKHMLHFLKKRLPEIYKGLITPPAEEESTVDKTSPLHKLEADTGYGRW